jgi:hypothetical protein
MAKTLEEFEAWLDEMDGIKPQKPKAVVEEGEVVRDADPHVSVDDPNYSASEEGVVKVRREDWWDDIRRHNAALQGRELGCPRSKGQWKVEVDKTSAAVPTEIDKALEQRREWAREERRHRRMLDPCRLGLWGPTDDDDAA